tara:strand:+ start:57750 stop:57950 length:201 start_codon:yes stop_codon:yes gene_type:complete
MWTVKPWILFTVYWSVVSWMNAGLVWWGGVVVCWVAHEMRSMGARRSGRDRVERVRMGMVVFVVLV